MYGELPGFSPGFSICLRVFPYVKEAIVPENGNVRSA